VTAANEHPGDWSNEGYEEQDETGISRGHVEQPESRGEENEGQRSAHETPRSPG
jgi:hypothetical protein